MALLGNYLSIKDDVCVEWVVLGLGGVGVEMVHVGVGEKNILKICMGKQMFGWVKWWL